MKILHTAFKQKIPRGFSYPVGAEYLSEQLNGVPQFDLMQLQFSWKDTFWASEHRAKVQASGDLRVIEAHHYSGTGFGSKWCINIHAVPSSHRQDARAGLAEVLPELSEALCVAGLTPRYFHWVAAYGLSSRRVARVT